MRRKVLLHKLILLEVRSQQRDLSVLLLMSNQQLLAMSHGTLYVLQSAPLTDISLFEFQLLHGF